MIRRVSPEFLAVISGLLLAFSYPPFDLFFLAWVAWLPLWIAIQQKGWQSGFRLGYLTGFVFTLLTFNWIANNSGTSLLIAMSSMLGAVLYLSLAFGLYGFLIAGIGRRAGTPALWLAPFLWVSIEYLYSYPTYDMAFPWMNMAMTQNFMLPLLQLAEYGGVFMVSFWVMVVNTVLYQIEFGRLSLRNQHLLWGILGLSIVGFILFGGVRMKVISESYSKWIPVGVVQTNLDPAEKWVRSKKTQHVEDVMKLTREAVAQGASIVVWPESAVPAHLRYYPQFDRMIKHFVRSENVSILTGALHHEREGDAYRYFNSAFFYAPGEPVPIYSKQRLVPFAERIPLSNRYPILKNLNFGQANFEPGEGPIVHPMGSDSLKVPTGTMICYESADPHIFRGFIDSSAALMTIITNDAWLGRSLGPVQHLAAGRLRAIEHRISIARAAQTGISAFIMPSGRIVERIPLGGRGTFVVDAPVGLPRTTYSTQGDLFALLVILLSSAGLLFILVTRTRSGRK